MLAAQIDPILADFTRRRIPFSHRDVADRIPALCPQDTDAVRQLVLEKMSRVKGYHLSVAHFVGEGLTVMCIPGETAPAPSVQIETPVVEGGRLVA